MGTSRQKLRRFPQARGWASAGLVLAGMLCWLGCGHRPAPLPATYRVHGTVVYKDGTPVTRGLVQFQPQADASVTTTAAIGKDGAYSLTTMRDGLRAEGAVAGPNRVIVIPFTTYPAPYVVKPCDNEFRLVVKRTAAN